MEELFVPIETEVGIVFGRDAIFLDEITFDYPGNRVTFGGELNSGLCSKRSEKNEWIKYSISFSGVVCFQMTELDFADFRGKSSLDLVQNSKWMSELKKFDSAHKIKPEHRHYFLQTYDDIFEIIGLDFELKLSDVREQK